MQWRTVFHVVLLINNAPFQNSLGITYAFKKFIIFYPMGLHNKKKNNWESFQFPTLHISNLIYTCIKDKWKEKCYNAFAVWNAYKIIEYHSKDYIYILNKVTGLKAHNSVNLVIFSKENRRIISFDSIFKYLLKLMNWITIKHTINC